MPQPDATETQACRQRMGFLKKAPDPQTPAFMALTKWFANPGLILSRMLPSHDDSKDKRAVLYAALQAQAAAYGAYAPAFDRWKANLPPGTDCRPVTTSGRILCGAGASSVLETGLALHHTYGVPFIPGSSLKGLAAHYCDRVWGPASPQGQFLRKTVPLAGEVTDFQTIFGKAEDAGHLIFHDAWLDPACLKPGPLEHARPQGLVLDVITPHHKQYYETDGARPPTDYDSPEPHPFLSVAGVFYVAVTCDSPRPADLPAGRPWWDDLAMKLLCEALEHWGAGAKTSSGYGRIKKLGDCGSWR